MFDLTRRRLIRTAALAVGALAIGARAATPPEIVPPNVALCRFLTGWQGLDARLVVRAFAALAVTTPRVAVQARALWDAITAAGLKSVADFSASPLYGDAGHRATAGLLAGVFYLGVVGEGDAATLVSYEAALMFAPTQDATPIPSYAIGGPGWWGALE